MLLGYNTNGLVHHRLEDAIRLLHDEGFRAIAITPDVGQLDPARVTAAEVSRVAAELARTGLVPVIETGARYVLDPRRKHRPNLLETDPAERRVRAAFLERCLTIARDLGARTVSLWAGALPEGVREADARDRLHAGLDALTRAADRLELEIALEPEPGMLIETVAGALAVLGGLGNPPNLGLTLDVGHLYVTGEGSPAAIVPATAGRLRQVHVEDIRAGEHVHLPPGQGDVDFEEIWDALETAGYDGPVCFELSRSSHAAPEMLRLAKRTFERRKAPPRR